MTARRDLIKSHITRPHEATQDHCYMKTVNLFSTTMEKYYTVHFTNYVALSNAIYFLTKKSPKYGNYDALVNAT